MTHQEIIRIEHGIPMPKRRKNATKYPFADMAVGDSFEVAVMSGDGVATQARQWGQRQNPVRKFSQHVQRHKNWKLDKVRIWRTE